jgi:acyl-CoA synthetase (AMP-forming)/AMP-acid ligase II
MARYFGDLRVAASDTLQRGSVEPGCAYSLGIPVIDLLPRPAMCPAHSALFADGATAVVGELTTGADDAFMLLTSGTTSQPKLVPLTQSSVCLSAYNVGAALALEAQDRLLSVLPLFHGHGLISGLLAALAAGSSVVCPPAFDAEAFFGWLTKCRPTWYTAVPPIHRALISAARRRKRGLRQSSLRLIRSASSSLPTDVLEELEGLFGVPVIETYGMTEAATQIAANPLEQRKSGSVGKPAGAEIAVMDGEGRQLTTGKHGEVVLRGPTITRGYDNNDAATKSAFRNGWFRTGDLGYMDPEGYLFLIGRIKKADVINRGGQKVSPAEVEKVLLSHPEVAEAVAFPITHTALGRTSPLWYCGRGQDQRAEAPPVRERAPGAVQGSRPDPNCAAIPAGPGGKIICGELATMLDNVARSRVERDDKSVRPARKRSGDSQNLG